jgi:transposase
MVSDEIHAQVRLQLADALKRIAHLETQLGSALERLGEGPPPPAPPARQPPGWVKANVPPCPPAERAPRRKRAPEHNHARRREAPTRVVEHPITHCPDCGNRLGGVHVGRRRQVIDLPPPPPVEVVEHQVARGWCSACRRWHEASVDLAGHAVGQGRLGVGVASLVAHLRFVLRLPIRAIQAFLADEQGLRVSVGELVELLHRVAAHAAPAVAAIRDQARRRGVVNADETTWREAGQNGYAWLLSTPEGERYVEWHRSRAGAVANALVGEDFTGVLVSDFYGGYNDTPGGRHQRCWVHLLRDVRALAEAHRQTAGQLGLEVRAWTEAIMTLWLKVQAAHTHPPPTAAARELVAHRLLLEVQALGAQFVEAPGHPCHALAWRLWRFGHEVLTCVRQPEVPPDNNAAERAIRPLVVVRKISGGTRSPRGSTTRMTLYSLFATWLAKGLAPLAECRALLQSPLPQI